MKIISAILAFMLFTMVLPQAVYAKVKMKCPNQYRVENVYKLPAPIIDTLPAPAKPAETPAGKPAASEKPVTAVIKEVPKARKVAVPRPVTVKVKGLKVVKPKIIKPVLKVL